MRSSIVFAALALASSVFATESLFTCPSVHKVKKTCSASNSTHKASGGTKKKIKFTPAKATTTAVPIKGDLVEIKTGTYAIFHVESGLFLNINLINGKGIVSLTPELALVSVNQIPLGNRAGGELLAITLSAGIDFELDLVLNAVIKGDVEAAAAAGLQLVVGGLGDKASCSPYYQPVKCGVVPPKLLSAASKMAKIPVLSSVLDLAAHATAAVGLDALVDVLVSGVAELIVSVCLVAYAEVDVKAQALTIDRSTKTLSLDAFVETEANAWVFVKIAAAATLL